MTKKKVEIRKRNRERKSRVVHGSMRTKGMGGEGGERFTFFPRYVFLFCDMAKKN